MLQISETGRQALTDMRRSLGVLRTGERDAERHPPPGIAVTMTHPDKPASNPSTRCSPARD
ncbi:hypothetical protein [Streptomyces sp. NBC_01408]|uniref:hypothetical protein n=1 Tax=Streptomyces sp. NBC_01408 TaxID=2903855 RepID=UPI00225BBE52|nr:hypothetical protein [Streptomyces sp. NBC_01408]MCX4695507.1 hypothetical protein [Streptomyces sp. NBC_01408]